MTGETGYIAETLCNFLMLLCFWFYKFYRENTTLMLQNRAYRTSLNTYVDYLD